MRTEPGKYADKGDWKESEDVTRPRGIFSPKERAHLAGWLDEDAKDDTDAIRQREYRMREHIRNVFRDFAFPGCEDLVAEVLREEIGWKPNKERSYYFRQIPSGVSALLSAIYTSLAPPDIESIEKHSTLDIVLKEGISESVIQSAAQRGISVIPNLTLEIDVGETMDIDELHEMYESHDFEEMVLLPDELAALFYSGRLSPVEHNAYAEKATKEQAEAPERYKTKLIEAYDRRGYDVSPDEVSTKKIDRYIR